MARKPIIFFKAHTHISFDPLLEGELGEVTLISLKWEKWIGLSM